MIIDILDKIVRDTLIDIGYNISPAEAVVTNSDRPELSDYQCNAAFSLCKIYKKSPMVIANEFVTKLIQSEETKQILSKIEVAAPGFINLTLTDRYISGQLDNIVKDEKYSILKSGKKVVIDYGGPNVAKPLHVGHLRSALVGESIKRILQYGGDSVISDIHLGDFGLQIGQVIYGIQQSGKDIEQITIEDLDKIYPAMSAKCKADPNINEMCATITKELQNGNEKHIAYWQKIMTLSKNDMKEQYDYLDIYWDLWEGESDAYPYFPALTDILNKKKLLTESEGCTIIRLSDNEDIPPLIFMKGNGAYLYGSTDLATIKKRYDLYKPDEIVYVVDRRQSLHFSQVFATGRLADIAPETTFSFCGFGTVNGIDGKPFKTRAGDAPKLTSLFKQVKDALKTIEQNALMSDSDLDKLVNATIKFADLQNNRERDYIFDIEKFSKTNGKTGPYILYSFARLNSIVNETTFDKSKFSGQIYNETDRNLRLHLIKFSEAFKKSYDEKQPNILAEYLYDLCVKANAFYENNRIKNNSNLTQKNDWCNLVSITTQLINTISSLLVIEQPDSMKKTSV